MKEEIKNTREKTEYRKAEISHLSDEEMVALAQEGDRLAEEQLIRRYYDLISSKASLYYIVGADRDDVIQEGMIGILDAIKDFRPGKGAAFKTFAELCITRQILNAVKAAGRKKHQPLNQYLSIEAESQQGAGVFSGFADSNDNPEIIIVMKDIFDCIYYDTEQLFSKLEFTVWQEYAKGRTTGQIAALLGKDVTAINNTLQRVRRKIYDYIYKSNI